MITQEDKEPRLEYLLRVAVVFMRDNGIVASETVDYDETTCDGYCLAEELEGELNELKFFRENK